MQEVLQNRIISFEFIGLLLAVLSFTGATEKIEGGLSSLRSWVANYTPALRRGLVEFLPTPANFRRHGGGFMRTVAITVVIATLFMLLTDQTRSELYVVYSLILPWSWWKVILVVVLIIPTMYLLATFIGFIGGIFAYIVLTILWLIFWALSRPPSGVMGSVGLLVAVAGPVLRLVQGS